MYTWYSCRVCEPIWLWVMPPSTHHPFPQYISPSFLAAPVVQEGPTSWDVYLPTHNQIEQKRWLDVNESHPPQMLLPFFVPEPIIVFTLFTHTFVTWPLCNHINSLLSQHFSTCKLLTKTLRSKRPAVDWLIVVYCSSVSFGTMTAIVYNHRHNLGRYPFHVVLCIYAEPELPVGMGRQ